jgi:hypothetical protein
MKGLTTEAQRHREDRKTGRKINTDPVPCLKNRLSCLLCASVVNLFEAKTRPGG